MDLRDASHEQAVEAIRRAGECVDFLVQSGEQRSQVRCMSKNSQKISHSSGLKCVVQCQVHMLCIVKYLGLLRLHIISLRISVFNKCSGMVQCIQYWSAGCHQKFQQCCVWEFVALKYNVIWTQSILNKSIILLKTYLIS